MDTVSGFLAKGSGKDAKHWNCLHACVSCALLHAVMLAVGLCVDSILCWSDADGSCTLPRLHWAAYTILAYWLILVGHRLRNETSSNAVDIYNLMFLCNVSMPIAAFAIMLQRPALLCAQAILVAIDQVLWYVDIFGYIATGKLPLKVVGYLFFPETPISRKVTCVHHVLFEPFVIFVLAHGQSLPVGRAFVVSALQTVACQAVCRYTTPLQLLGDEGQKCYLNINLCYEVFRDIKVAWIRRYDNAAPHIYLPWMLWIWNLGNLLLFVALATTMLKPLHLLGLPGARITF